jgi:cysteinyl-tRNA synthetase
MALRIYNTRHRKKEIFEPVEPGKVRMYVCGPTVYDACHIGHARSVVVFDVVFRYLEALEYEVTYVRNFTDVDDKIIRRANELGVSCDEIAEKFIREFHRDMDALHVRRATLEPRATAHIADIIDVIQILIEKGYAYEIEGDVFFSVEKFERYGQLSGRRLEDMAAGARVDVDERKHNPFDFALWKSMKPGEPWWESPWGKGRPGWHIECSAMSRRFLGNSFDIHGGGRDLVFPHHENEIAQSEAAFGQTFVRYWVHNGFVNIDHEKMSKSLNNFLMIHDVLQETHPEAVRLFLLSKHYRSPIDFTDHQLQETRASLDKIYTLIERVGDWMPDTDAVAPPGPGWRKFQAAMDDDFNTARGIGVLFEIVRDTNRWLDQMDAGAGDAAAVRRNVSDLRRIGDILGIMAAPADRYFASRKESVRKDAAPDSAAIEELVRARTHARSGKNWEEADRIRKELEDRGVVLEDRADGTAWKWKA